MSDLDMRQLVEKGAYIVCNLTVDGKDLSSENGLVAFVLPTYLAPSLVVVDPEREDFLMRYQLSRNDSGARFHRVTKTSPEYRGKVESKWRKIKSNWDQEQSKHEGQTQESLDEIVAAVLNIRGGLFGKPQV